MTGSQNRQPEWLTAFDLPCEPTGAVIALDLVPEGLWAARVRDGSAAESELEDRIHPSVLDARIAGYLRDSGKVDAAAPEVFAELLAVAGRARASLVGRDSALIMGDEHLRFVMLTLDDVVEATVPEANRAHGMIVELAGLLPVDAVLLGPGHVAWPGLWEALTERGFSVLQPGDDFPETFGGNDSPTELLSAVEAPQAVRAWDAAAAGPELVNPADYNMDRFGNTVHQEPVGPVETDSAEPQPGMRGRMIAVAAVTLLAVGGGGVALAMNAHESSGPDRNAAESATRSSSKAPGTTSEPVRVPGSVDPKDLAAARVPMLKYTTPPPPPPKKTTKEQSSEAQTGPAPQAPARPHRRRTIPNPIPGLPPIVIG
ncbi:hypothetical protein [Gordonia neofelifaecis]|uniref:Uncharacterized protein n=1 Tax=Gordonia neofelifaecis NRRL B-59395 TaxID=644548 RepID=F1YNA6_9ACTN|nr:hypothetical protein [Gordonia neofelifaecis]EGD53817.1 hypothetical protein SCNU_17023 [Gordonia neofelifaecis NRRL B-59395]